MITCLGRHFLMGRKTCFQYPNNTETTKSKKSKICEHAACFKSIYAACFRSICSILFRHWMAEYFKSLKLWLFGVFFWLIFFRCTQLAFFVKCVWVKMLVNLSTWAEIESVGMWKCTACFVFTRTYIESAEKLFPRIGSRDNSHNPLTPDLQKDRTL